MKTAALVTGLFLLGVPGCIDQQPERPDIVADLACETAAMVVRLQAEIAPTPASDTCDNCNGTGKIGDGRIVMECPVCKGTGKKSK